MPISEMRQVQNPGTMNQIHGSKISQNQETNVQKRSRVWLWIIVASVLLIILAMATFLLFFQE